MGGYISYTWNNGNTSNEFTTNENGEYYVEVEGIGNCTVTSDTLTLEKLNFDQLVSTICMISPFSAEEKQKLIETVSVEDKLDTLGEILNFNLIDNQGKKTIQ